MFFFFNLQGNCKISSVDASEALVSDTSFIVKYIRRSSKTIVHVRDSKGFRDKIARFFTAPLSRKTQRRLEHKDNQTTFINMTSAACKRTQNCWTTTPNIVGCYMLRPIGYPCSCCVVSGVVAQSLKPIKCLAMCKYLQHCCPTTLNIVRLYIALDSLDAYIIWPRQITLQSPSHTVVFIKKGRFTSLLVLFCGASYQSNNHLL